MCLKELINERKCSKMCAVADQKRSLSYAQLYAAASKISELFLQRLSHRSHVAILLPDSVEYVIAFSSILLADCIIIPIYAKASKSEIENAINFCDVAAIITDTKIFSSIHELSINHEITVFEVNTCKIKECGIQGKPAIPQNSVGAAIMLSTSGSTSAPKRVMLSNDNLIANATAIIQSLGYTEHEHILTLLPLTMASGNTSQLIVSLILGSTLYIYQEPLHPKFLFREIKRNEITTTTIVPSILRLLLSEHKDHADDCKTLKTICFGGGPTDTATMNQIKQSGLWDRFVHMYGQTEASTRISHLHFQTEAAKLPSVGKPLFNIAAKIEITEPDGKTGEILVQGPNIMMGYYKERNQPIREQWLHTGDLGYIDEHGYLYVTGRIKNIIICSGMNIYAEEVEDVLCRHPSVMEALVYGIPDERHGELPVADVVLCPLSKISEQDLREYCARELATFKVPSAIHVVNELKRTYNGKVARNRNEKEN